MEAFLLYLLRSGLYIGIFYAFFLLVMRKTTFFRLNRILLLAGTAVCMLLPLLKVRTIEMLVSVGRLQAVAGGETAADGAVEASATTWALPAAVIFLAGCVAVLVSVIVSSVRMYRIVNSGERKVIDNYRTVISDTCKSSFSFGRLIVVGRQDLEENPAVFTHEKMHVKCRHYLDLFIFTPVQILYWWNPLVWITRTELCLLHEFEADEGVIAQGIEARQYQLLLVRKAVGDERFLLASGFKHSKLKNRIAMMLNEGTSRSRCWSYLAVLPCLAAAVFACNPANVLEGPEPVKDVQEFSLYVNQVLDYPKQSMDAGIQGRVALSFEVDADGSISNIKVIKGVHPDLDAEALRAVSECAKQLNP
ncbi:MAG: M56 family metallopeptidase [Bacteroidales bacterium]|nr:M56 family metallopeptidase [Bacteroidales bacterium]